MTIKYNSIVHPRPTNELLQKMEKYWEVTLPKDYREFIMKYNGGIPNENQFCSPCHQWDGMNRFLCVLENYRDNPHGWYDINVIESQIGERLTTNPELTGIDLLPIADLYFGDYLCLDFRNDKKNPTICIWSHEESGDFDPTTYPLANNFTEFLGMLTTLE